MSSTNENEAEGSQQQNSNQRQAYSQNLPVHKVIFIGDSSVGKTSIITRFIHNSCNPAYSSTIGIDYFSKTVPKKDDPNGTQIQLQIWDTAGQEKFRALVPAYIRPSTVAIIVYDITLRQSFDNIQQWHQMVLNSADPAFILVGNKVDLETERAVSEEEGRKCAAQIKAQFIETSATQPTNIEELFDMVCNIPIVVKEEPQEEKQIMITIPADQISQPPKQGGCSC